MIIKMKSIYVLGLESYKDDVLLKLTEAGVVHVKHIKPPEGSSIEELNNNIQKASNILPLLQTEAESIRDDVDAMAVVEKLFQLGERRRSLNEKLIQLRREEAKVSYLGDFSPEDIRQLENRNIKFQLYKLKKNQVSEIPSDVVFSILAESKGSMTIAAVFSGEEKFLPFHKEPIPTRSMGQINKRIEKVKVELNATNIEIEMLAGYRNKIEKVIEELKNQKEIQKAIYGMGRDEDVAFLKGFCPEPEIEKLKKAAEKNAFGLIFRDPDTDEEPPILLKNPKWVDLIKPVFAIINTLPGYREFDISMWFLLFFSIFFSLLIGDAGYGFIFFGITTFSHFIFRKKIPVKAPFYLMYILSTCTIIWGAVTGNWLGIEAISEKMPFKNMIVPSLDVYSGISQTTMMNLCFIIGVIQLSIAHFLVFFRYINRLKALAQIGWICVLWSVFFLARNLVLSFAIPWYFNHLLISGVVLVILFTNPQKNILKGMLSGIADLPMTAINSFADNMSYIRLFAVGTATFAVAQSFNNIGLEVGFGNIFNGFLATLILVFGHGLNIILAAMAVIVHGVRLNMLEFSGHVGNTWSGFEYKPLKKLIIKKEI
jgi:V/A-type H+-transporting ATPase subunit I